MKSKSVGKGQIPQYKKRDANKSQTKQCKEANQVLFDSNCSPCINSFFITSKKILIAQSSRGISSFLHFTGTCRKEEFKAADKLKTFDSDLIPALQPATPQHSYT